MGSRRAFLRASAIMPLAAACAPEVLLGQSGVVRIAVPWSGSELAAFRGVLAGVAGSQPVEVIPLGDEIETAFAAGGQTAPDIVMLPRAGRIDDLVANGKLLPVPETLWAGEYPDYWRPLLTHDAKLYGVPFKVADKSMIWYDREAVERYRLGDPESWTLASWTEDAMGKLARTPSRLLALAGADGWVLTDLFENILRSENPDAYDLLATARGDRDWSIPGVPEAFGHFGTLCGDQHSFPGGVGASLTRQFPDAVREVFERRNAVLVVAPDFAESVVRRSIRRAGRPDSVVGIAEFPRVAAGKDRPHVIGGDIIVLTRAAGAAAQTMVAKLAAPRAPLAWIQEHGGFLAANKLTPPAYSEWLRPRAAALATRGDSLAFELSDRIGVVGGRNGLWRILTEFLVAVGDGGPTPVALATDRAIADLNKLERQR
ncbi:ABC transporter substrate-binding protein [Nocardia sp. NPDC051832]|uniref:ABC transporter substrate-binding protein n=1 Tax=Nocardia sp. NPDC051832 TaxID=3155673 RepID=UPI003434B5A9